MRGEHGSGDSHLRAAKAGKKKKEDDTGGNMVPDSLEERDSGRRSQRQGQHGSQKAEEIRPKMSVA